MDTEVTAKPGFLLVIGAILGAALAASGILETPRAALGKDLVANVNGEYVSKSDYLGYLDLLARDKRNPMSATDRRHVLDRIIEEKLLIERGLGIGLPYSDPKVRKAIVNAMIETIVSDASSADPEPATLSEFYRANSKYFSSPDSVRVQRMVFRGKDAGQRARAAHELLATQEWHSVATRLADPDILALPGSLLPVRKLRGYLGPTLTEQAINLPVGSFSPPLSDQAGYTIVQLLDLRASEPQPLEKIREQVLREFQRRASDNALRDYLQELREAADIRIDEEFLGRLNQLESSGA